MECLTDYDRFAPYYGALLERRGHFRRQALLVTALFREQGTTLSGRILDAACGTGELVRALRSAGFSNVYGCDGSRAMLEQAWSAGIAPGVVEQCRWEQLPSYLAGRPPFDAVILLGHSLPHASRDHLPTILQHLRAAVRPGGFLVFDLRDWERTQDVELREPARPEGIWRELDEVAHVEGTVYIRDRCTYGGERQVIEYEVYRVTTGSSSTVSRFSLSYAMFTPGECREWLLAAGFSSVGFESRADWPYVVCISQ